MKNLFRVSILASLLLSPMLSNLHGMAGTAETCYHFKSGETPLFVVPKDFVPGEADVLLFNLQDQWQQIAALLKDPAHRDRIVAVAKNLASEYRNTGALLVAVQPFLHEPVKFCREASGQDVISVVNALVILSVQLRIDAALLEKDKLPLVNQLLGMIRTHVEPLISQLALIHDLREAVSIAKCWLADFIAEEATVHYQYPAFLAAAQALPLEGWYGIRTYAKFPTCGDVTVPEDADFQVKVKAVIAQAIDALTIFTPQTDAKGITASAAQKAAAWRTFFCTDTLDRELARVSALSAKVVDEAKAAE